MSKKDFTGERWMSPVGRFAFLSVFKPVKVMESRDNDDVEFTVTLILDKKRDAGAIKDLNAICKRVLSKMLNGKSTKRKINSPIKDGDVPNTNGTLRPEYKGKWYIKVHRKVKDKDKINTYRPRVAGADLRLLSSPDDIKSGDYGCVHMYVCPYDNAKLGVTCILNDVQLVRRGAPLGGTKPKLEDVFNAYSTDDEGLEVPDDEEFETPEFEEASAPAPVEEDSGNDEDNNDFSFI